MTTNDTGVNGVEIVTKDLPGFRGDAWLVEVDHEIPVAGADEGVTTKHFVVSGVTAPFTGWECLAFPADEDGDPINFREHAGGSHCSHYDVLEILAEMARDEASREVEVADD